MATLEQLRRIKAWHVAQRSAHPMELHLLDAVLTLWLMGWGGVLPCLILDTYHLLPLCLLGMLAPGLYLRWRGHLHRQAKLRCDWLAT